MAFTSVAATISTILAIYAGIPYIISIVKGKTKPHQLSWLVFVIMNGIVAISQYLAGGRGSVLISFTFFAGSLANFLLSLKYGVRETSRWDRLLFSLAIITIIIWWLTRSNATAIWLTMLIDIFATSMIILKLRTKPRSEDPLPWTIVTLAYVFTCLTLWGKPLGILYVRPLYGLIGDAILLICIYYFRSKSRSAQAVTPVER